MRLQRPGRPGRASRSAGPVGGGGGGGGGGPALWTGAETNAPITNGTEQVIGLPVHDEGDLILVMTNQRNSTLAATLTAGWDLIIDKPGGAAMRMMVWAKIAGASEPNPSIFGGSNGGALVGAITISGAALPTTGNLLEALRGDEVPGTYINAIDASSTLVTGVSLGGAGKATFFLACGYNDFTSAGAGMDWDASQFWETTNSNDSCLFFGVGYDEFTTTTNHLLFCNGMSSTLPQAHVGAVFTIDGA